MAYNSHLIQPDQLQYFLTTSTVEDELLEMAPEDWDDSSVTVKKDMTNYVANRREFSLPLGFTKRGRDLLKEEFRVNGIMGHAVVRIMMRNDSTWLYEPFYTGKIDFAKADLDLNFMEVNFLDGDLQAKLKAYESTDFEIGFTQRNSLRDFDVIAPPIFLTEFGQYFIASQRALAMSIIRTWGVMVGMGLNENKVRMGAVSFYEQRNEQKPQVGYNIDNGDNSFARPTRAGLTLRLELNMVYSAMNYEWSGLEGIQGFKLVVDEVIWEEDDSIWRIWRTELFDFKSLGVGEFLDREKSISTTIESQRANSHLFLMLIPSNNSNLIITPPMYAEIKEATFTVEYDDFTPEDRIPSMTPLTLFRELMVNISGDPAIEVRSNFLENHAKELFISSGDAIRGISNIERGFDFSQIKIKTNFKDFWKAISSIYDVGFDIINGIPTLEEKSYFFDPSRSIEDLGEVDEYKITPATSLIYNDIRVGYNSEDYQAEDGRTEYNNGQTWKTPITAGKNTLDLVSPYRADFFGINEIREKFLYSPQKNKLKEDQKEDNDVFMFWVDLNSYEPYYYYLQPPEGRIDVRQSYRALIYDAEGGIAYIVGLNNKAIPFNWMISPQVNLLRHSRTLSTAMYGQVNQNKNLILTKTDKNSGVYFYEDLGKFFYGSYPIPVSSLSDPYFIPFEVTIKLEFPRNFYNNFMYNSTGYVSFRVGGNSYKIFVKEISFDVIKRSDFEIKGYLCPDQDLTNLFS